MGSHPVHQGTLTLASRSALTDNLGPGEDGFEAF